MTNDSETNQPENLSPATLAAEEAGVYAAVPAPEPEPVKVPALNRGFITISVMSAAIMQAIDGTIANVALPRMQGNLAATQDEITWVLTSYIIASAIMIPLMGWLAGRFGRKKVFLISIIGFTVSSALCGMAVNLPDIVLFRLLQGMAGAALVPLSQAVLLDINPPENIGRAMALWGIGVTMGPVLGPALGGWLTENYNWRWVFFINVPIGIAAFLGLSASMPETHKHKNRFDFFGFITLSVCLAAVQLMLDCGELKDWFNSGEIVIEALTGGLALYLFLIHTLSHPMPFLNPTLFRDRNFLAGNLFIFLIGVVLFATLALIPPMLQHEMGYSALTTGLVTAPRGMGTMTAMLVVGRLTGRLDARLIIAIGLSLTVFSLWQMTNFSLLMDKREVIFSGLTQGFGIGLSYIPLSTVAFGTLPAHLRNEGTAFFNLLRNIGSAIGISIVQTLLTRKTQMMHSYLAEHITPYNLGNPAYAANHIDPTSQSGLALLNGMITNQSAMISYINDYKLMMITTIAVIPLLFLMRRPGQTPVPQHAAAE